MSVQFYWKNLLDRVNDAKIFWNNEDQIELHETFDRGASAQRRESWPRAAKRRVKSLERDSNRISMSDEWFFFQTEE